MKKFFVTKTIGGESVKYLTAQGRSELARLEPIYLRQMTSVYKEKKYSFYSDAEKLESLLRKEKKEKMAVVPEDKIKKVSIVDYLSSRPEIDWLNLDYKTVEALGKAFAHYSEEYKIMVDLILSERRA